MNAHCRIGRVHSKEQPKITEIIPRKRGIEKRQLMHQYIDQICDYVEKDGIAGFALVAWDFKGVSSHASGIHEDSYMSTKLLPSFVAEIFRKDISEDVAKAVLRGDF